jgi:anti-sigma regulatory factor (Ser/Thr protein kinase)
VRDRGHWVDRGPEGPPRYRGNGLPLMNALMDTVELRHDNGDGTAVRMARSLSPDRVVAGA